MNCLCISRVFTAVVWVKTLDLNYARAVVVTRLCSLARGYSGVSHGLAGTSGVDAELKT